MRNDLTVTASPAMRRAMLYQKYLHVHVISLYVVLVLTLLCTGCGGDDEAERPAAPAMTAPTEAGNPTAPDTTAPAQDRAAPVATIAFPGTSALLTSRQITVRGTAKDQSTITSVTVNGIPATSTDGFATWVARVSVPLGTSKVMVSTTDEFGNTEAQAATATVTVVETFVPFQRPAGIAVEASGTLVVVDADLDAVVRLNPVSGARTIVADATTGSGPALVTPVGIAVEASGTLAVVDAGLKAVVRVNPVNGARTIVSDATIGSGQVFFLPLDIAVEATGTLVVVDAIVGAVMRVDPVNGARTIVSHATIGSGPIFNFLIGIAVEATGTLVVVDTTVFPFNVVLRVNPVSGARTIVADATTGSGPALVTPVGIAVEASGTLVVDVGRDAVVRINPDSGIRTIVSDAITGSVSTDSAPVFRNQAGIAVEAPGTLVLVVTVADSGHDAVIRVDPVTGNHTAFSNNAVGSGPVFRNPAGIAVEAPGTLVLVDDGRDAVMRVDTVSGIRTIVSDATTGSGPTLVTPRGIAVEPSGTLVVVDSEFAPFLPSFKSVLRIDPGSDARTLASRLFAPLSIAVEASGTLVVVNSGGFLPDPGVPTTVFSGADDVVRVEPVSGATTLVSQVSKGSHPMFSRNHEDVRDIAVEATGGLVVVDVLRGLVLRVDPVSGAQTIVSDATTGSGPALVSPVSIAVEASGTLVVVDEGRDAVVRVDPTSGARTILSEATTGSGPTFVSPGDIAVEASGTLVVVDNSLKAVLRVDAISGDRAIIAK